MGGHGFKYVGDRDDAHLKTERFATQAVRITRAIQPFVVLGNNFKDRPREVDILEDACSRFGMRLDNRIFKGAQAGGFDQKLDRDGQFSDVMHGSAQAQSFDSVLLQTEFLGNRNCDFRNPLLVSTGIGVARFHRPAHRHDGADQGIF